MVLRQFHLRLSVCRVCIGGENVENQTRAVEDTALQGLLHVAGLGRAQFVVDDGNLDVLRLDVLVNLLQLA